MNADLFWAKVDRTGEGCWLWTAARNHRTGYGKFGVDGRTLSSHRVAYELAVGILPDGYEADHLCFTPLCCRPSHLQAVPRSVNIRRQRSSYIEVCVNGHPYDEANTYWRPRGGRDCRVCIRERQRRKNARAALAPLPTSEGGV